ncbi:3-hydroxyacyl-CoA dehydrogenase family protein [Kutzneria sp. CA-103260]|uniref:3-hydroxyacyl-CoA dehydrogenase family protein n=1 Tax=Kutzneria sp. CA-103260 TaxID=2802641 RepID=UPI001BA4A113|nr:3-hydroxyacyl-CoA dehydrogenase [Kutzneria sp. CA-103260]QUQ65441.1 3-hydroxyacyl-CoA dehydrogenase [Kutzneria sp. CA-103260]
MARPFAKVAMIGLGATGSALAVWLAAAGRHVVGIEADGTALAAARERVRRRIEETVPADRAAEVSGRIQYAVDVEAASDAELVVEAVPEQLPVKLDVFARADEVCPDDTVFVTTTTGLSITEIASRSGRMPRTVGLHLFPAATSLEDGAAELVSTPVTEHGVPTAMVELISELGLTAVEVGDHAGFVGGALLMGYLNGAATMYEQGYASRDDIDTAMRLGCGLPTGPLEQIDQIGVDVVHDTLHALHERCGDRTFAPARVLTQMRVAGLHGQKTGRGFYDYGPAAATAAPVAKPQDVAVRAIGVVGSGRMATGIAEVCARAGYRTVVAARNDVRAKEALGVIDESLTRGVRRGRLTTAEQSAIMDRLAGVGALGGLADCDLVIEAVAEDLDVKRRVFAELDSVCDANTVLATTTSSLPVLECATATSRPHRVIGMHFFNPAPAMRLVEVVRTLLTSDATVATARAVTASLGRTAVGCGDRAGFIVNALLFPYLNRAAAMLDDRWVSAADIDAVMTGGHGFPLGPLTLLDLVGLDVSLQIQRSLDQAFGGPALAPAKSLVRLVDAGYLGRKTGRGFHIHESG